MKTLAYNSELVNEIAKIILTQMTEEKFEVRLRIAGGKPFWEARIGGFSCESDTYWDDNLYFRAWVETNFHSVIIEEFEMHDTSDEDEYVEYDEESTNAIKEGVEKALNEILANRADPEYDPW